MRFSQQKGQLLKNEIHKCLPEAKIYLFGSRVDDAKKGGDIDILILANRPLHWKEKTMIRHEFWREFGEQKLDLVSFAHNSDDPFKEIALSEAVLL